MHETKMIGEFMIQKVKMMGGTDRYVFSAWEPGSLFGAHGTVTTEDGVWYGKIGTRATEGVELMKDSAARRILVETDRASQGEQARALILSAFPEAAAGQPRWGVLAHEIEIGG